MPFLQAWPSISWPIPRTNRQATGPRDRFRYHIRLSGAQVRGRLNIRKQANRKQLQYLGVCYRRPTLWLQWSTYEPRSEARPNCRRSDRPTRFQTSAVLSPGVGRMHEDTPQSNFARLSKLRRRAFPFNQGRYGCLNSRKTRRDEVKSVATLLLAFAPATARARRLHSLRQSPMLNEDGDIRSLRGKSDDNSAAAVPAGSTSATLPFGQVLHRVIPHR